MSLVDSILSAEQETQKISVGVISLRSIEKVEVPEGTKVGEFREIADLGSKIGIYTNDGIVLNNSDVLTSGMDVILGTAKEGGQ